MVQQHIMELLYFLLLIALLYVFYPSWCFGRFLKKQSYCLSERVLIYMLVMTFFITMLGYLLLAFDAMRFSVIFTILAVVLILCNSSQEGRLYGARLWKHRMDKWMRYFDGSASFRLFVEQKIRNTVRKFRILVTEHVIHHPIRTLAVTGTLAVFCYTRFYPVIVHDFYGMPDMYVHLKWLSRMTEGAVFPSGIYPESLHINILFTSRLFAEDITHVVKYWGAVNALAVLLGLYVLLRKCFRNQFTVMTGLWFVFCSGIVVEGALNRLSYTVPQEFGLLFLCGSAYFLLNYLDTKKISQLVYLGMSFAMTIMIHFYVTIMTVPLLLCVAIAYPKRCFCWRNFWKLAVTAILSVVIAFVPFLLAFAAGYEWNGSVDWALELMEENEETLTEESEDDRTEEEIAAEAYLRSQRHNENRAYSTYAFQNVAYYLGAMMVLSLIMMVIRGARKKVYPQMGAQAALMLYGICTFCIASLSVYGIFTLMPIDRITQFVAIFMTLGALMPLDELLSVEKGKYPAVQALIPGITAFAVLSGVLYMVFDYEILQKLGYHYQVEYDCAVNAIDEIKREHEKDTYTIVTSTDSLYRIKGSGYHYETWKFMEEMDHYDPEMSLRIPTPYVYFFVEKKTLNPSSAQYFSDNQVHGRFISEDLAYTDDLFRDEVESYEAYDYFYGNEENRSILDSKFYMWIAAYSQFFPKEMQVRYEDDNMIIYRFRQNVDAPANFAIPYLDLGKNMEVSLQP